MHTGIYDIALYILSNIYRYKLYIPLSAGAILNFFAGGDIGISRGLFTSLKNENSLLKNNQIESNFLVIFSFNTLHITKTEY